MSPKLIAWYCSTFGHAAVGAALLWMALPPLDLWPLAWIAPVWWVLLIRQDKLPGRRPYRAIYLAGFLFWMATVHWLRLPHWATCFGWLALAFYLGFYLPVFVGITRVAVHRLRLPVILAAPVVWTGLELARAHLLTGFTMASLGHTQYRWIGLIQISDLAGAFGVGFVVMLVAACLARMVPTAAQPGAVPCATASQKQCRSVRICIASGWPLVPAGLVVAATLLYGHLRISTQSGEPNVRVALIQGSVDTRMKADPDMRERVFDEYFQLSQKALKRHQDVDLIVWPETMFRQTLITFDDDARMPEFFKEKKWTQRQFQRALEEEAPKSQRAMFLTARELGVPLILGVDRHHFGRHGMQHFNSAAFVARDGALVGYYDKRHLVMFGEYVPLSRYAPWLQRLTPLGVNLAAGTRPASFELDAVRLTPDICYETVLSHVIRRQINVLRDERGLGTDVLVNLTNSGWYWGSSELDMHLICGVFRAVECRKPLLIAANTGFSAHIDADGRIVQQGPRRARATLLAEVKADNRRSWYLRYGDWPAGVCLAAAVIIGLFGLLKPLSTIRLPVPNSSKSPKSFSSND